uniref:Uncharacterized protein n=1 Tax=Equus caballus TaxID=9796 RepID=A0A3Q2H9P8_HORSE
VWGRGIGKKQPVKNPSRPRRWKRKTRLPHRNREEQKPEELKVKATGKGPLATDGIKKYGRK